MKSKYLLYFAYDAEKPAIIASLTINRIMAAMLHHIGHGLIWMDCTVNEDDKVIIVYWLVPKGMNHMRLLYQLSKLQKIS